MFLLWLDGEHHILGTESIEVLLHKIGQSSDEDLALVSAFIDGLIASELSGSA
jgi:hypothetical protein